MTAPSQASVERARVFISRIDELPREYDGKYINELAALLDAQIERDAKVAEGYIPLHDQYDEWADGVDHAKERIATAIREQRA